MAEEKKNTTSNRAVLQKAIDETEALFEKNLTYLSAGALGLSLTFIEKITPLDQAIALVFLIIGWILLSLTLAINLVSLLISKNYILKSQREYDNEEPDVFENIKKRNVIINAINWIVVILLVLGIASIVVFSSINAFHK